MDEALALAKDHWIVYIFYYSSIRWFEDLTPSFLTYLHIHCSNYFLFRFVLAEVEELVEVLAAAVASAMVLAAAAVEVEELVEVLAEELELDCILLCTL